MRFETSDRRLLTFLDLTRETSARFANHEVIGEKPLKEYLGPGLDGLSFTMELSAFGGVSPLGLVGVLDSAMQNGQQSNFILGGRNLGKFVIVSKSEAYGIITNRGAVVSASVDVKLEEYR